jgi:hypothetical protein
MKNSTIYILLNCVFRVLTQLTHKTIRSLKDKILIIKKSLLNNSRINNHHKRGQINTNNIFLGEINKQNIIRPNLRYQNYLGEENSKRRSSSAYVSTSKSKKEV